MNDEQCAGQLIFSLNVVQCVLKTRLTDITVAAGATGISLCAFRREDTGEEVVFTADSMVELLESVNAWVYTTVKASVDGDIEHPHPGSLLSELVVRRKFIRSYF